jgi:hypothetical protein
LTTIKVAQLKAPEVVVVAAWVAPREVVPLLLSNKVRVVMDCRLPNAPAHLVIWSPGKKIHEESRSRLQVQAVDLQPAVVVRGLIDDNEERPPWFVRKALRICMHISDRY